MNVFVILSGGLMFNDGVFVFGYYVEMEVINFIFVLISNCF